MELTTEERYARFADLRIEALKRFGGYGKIGQIVLFYYHDSFAVPLIGRIIDRIDEIVETKPVDQIPTRLKWIQPYIPGDPRMVEIDARYAEPQSKWNVLAEWDKLYQPIFLNEHPDCPWNGKRLFPNEEQGS